MGMGATNTFERIAASLGEVNGVKPTFTASSDVPNGGVLFALPALLVSGLLSNAQKYFQLPRGYYRLDSIFLLLAFMALARIKTVEKLRYCPPGEWGKLLGLDRIPEAKTLREKLGILSTDNHPCQWAAELSAQWMHSEPDSSAVLYIDGHVRVYSGSQTKLPRHYVARQKLCLRATTDYWVNAVDGQPFFLINKEVDPGLIKVMQEDIIPRLQREVPNQPTDKQMESDKLLHRFTVIFDREGYSPEFFLRMKQKRIACVTYHKYPGENWPEQEFISHQIKLSSGNNIEMKLAERGTFVGKKLWVREIRKLTESGHQTSVLSTDYRSDLKVVAAAMFSRWSQENFLKYMRLHYNLDRLIDYATEDIPETTRVINPQYRLINSEIKKKTGKLTYREAKFGAMIFNEDIEPKKVQAYQQKKGQLQEEISHLQIQLLQLKEKRKAIPKHITFSELPEEQRFRRLSTQSKYLIDTIKMIAYRAETAMASILRETMSHPDEARSLLRSIYSNEADIIPDEKASTLTIRLHQLANHCSSESIRYLCNELNATDTIFPGTNLRLIYELVS
jgi:hypothetical protein